jgi:hypothetical protein
LNKLIGSEILRHIDFPRSRPRAEAGLHFDPAMVAAYDSVPDAAFVRIRDGLA